MATYPSAIKTWTSLTDNVSQINADRWNELGDEITAIETELGTIPKGSDADVKTRLDRMEWALDTWTAKSDSTVYQAARDGFVLGFTSAGNDVLSILTDSANPPVTTRILNRDGAGAGSIKAGGMCPVKKNDYYKTLNAATVFFIERG